ncbi:transcriptional repressor LexA [Deinococcus yunweiensis]|uniref:transcriptional repressor LexA n=1 Tax=Deinococcus yunweiensis TaxID=367282 RepID=UPI00398F10F3
MPPRLTAPRLKLLQSIHRLTDAHGGPPSAAELARHLGYSEATISIHLRALTELGYVTRHGMRGRLQLTEKALALVQVGIPIYGQIAAGLPIPAEQSPDRVTPSLDALLGVQPGDFLLQVSGESMTGIGIMDGDYVLVRPTSEVHDGEVAVVLIPGGSDATLKRFYRFVDTAILESENPAMAQLRFPLAEVTVQGRMIGKLGRSVPRTARRG